MKNGLVALSLLALMLMGAMAVEAATATLTWTDNATNEMGYEIERKPVACATSGTFAKIGDVGVNAITYADSTVVEGATYCFRVRAWNTVDGTSTGTKQFSGYSNLAGITINFSTPAGPSQLGVTQAP